LQAELRRVRGVPRIALKLGRRDLGGEPAAELAKLRDIEVKVPRGIRFEIRQREMEQPHGGPQAAAVFRVLGLKEVLLQVYERAGELDEAFEKQMIVARSLEPQILEHVVRFVILPRIEAREIALISRIERKARIGAERFDEGGDAFVFFHRASAVILKLIRKLLC